MSHYVYVFKSYPSWISTYDSYLQTESIKIIIVLYEYIDDMWQQSR